MKLLLHLVLLFALVSPSPTHADEVYPRTGFATKLSTNAHGVRGSAEIVDARTIRLSHFYYDGAGPKVFVYLATANTQAAISNGIAIGNELSHTAYSDATITVTLPISGPILDGYSTISIWCVEFKVNFGSGVFLQNTYLPIVLSN